MALASSVSSWALVSRDHASDIAHQSLAAVTMFNVLSFTGLILLIALFFTALLSRNVHRVSTWYTYIASWAIYCLIPLPVLGRQTLFTSAPEFGQCVVNAAMMYASRPYVGFAMLALLLHLYITVSTRLKQQSMPRGLAIFLMIFPIAVYIALFVSILIVGLRNPSLVRLESGGYYCHLATPEPTIICAALVCFVTLAVIVIEALTCILLHRHWRAFRALQRRKEPGVSLSIIIRASVFAFLPFIGLVLSFLAYIPRMVGNIFHAYNLLLAFLPVAAAIIFGSQSDIIAVWTFWRWNSSDTSAIGTEKKSSQLSGSDVEASAGAGTVGTFDTITD